MILNIKCKKYRCQSCGQTFGYRYPKMRKSSNLTEALVGHIKRYSMTEETRASIARRTGACESMVRKYFRKVVERANSGIPTRHSVRALGIDGVGSSTIIVNLGKKGEPAVLGLLPEQDSAPKEVFGRKGQSLRGRSPDCDRHGHGLPQGHTRIQRGCSHRRRPIPRGPKSWPEELARRANLVLGKAKSKLLNTKAIRDEWKERKEALRDDWSGGAPAKQKTIPGALDSGAEGNLENELRIMEWVLKAGWCFRSIMTHGGYPRSTAHGRYRDWKRSLPSAIRGLFQEHVIGTVEDHKWYDSVMNFFEYPYTNGAVEGMNARVKNLKRRGAGYSNEALEAKMRSDDPFGN